MSIKSFFKSHGKQISILVIVTLIILIALRYEIDTKIVVFSTVVLGVFTQAFAGVAALIATLPVVGPLIIKIFTLYLPNLLRKKQLKLLRSLNLQSKKKLLMK